MSNYANIAVADCSPLKTEWTYRDASGKIHYATTASINPFVSNEKEMERILAQLDGQAFNLSAVQELYYFTMGCYSPDRREQLSNALSRKFTKAFISIERDILGASYLSWGNQKGLIALLDTVYNLAYYNGETIEGCTSGIGYILEEDLSWMTLGKHLLTDFLYENMPQDLAISFAEEYKLSKETVIKNLYKKTDPHSFMVSFKPFVQRQLMHPYIQALSNKMIHEFFDTIQKRYEGLLSSHSICFVGDLAITFEPQIRQIAQEYNLTVQGLGSRNATQILQHILQSYLVEN